MATGAVPGTGNGHEQEPAPYAGHVMLQTSGSREIDASSQATPLGQVVHRLSAELLRLTGRRIAW
jgi:hypothetical protein